MKPPAPAPLLRLTDVSRSFGGVRALSNVSCDVAPGQVVGIIGPNGAGKTTLFNIITGAVAPGAGEVRFDGEPITGWPPHRIARRGIARTFQNIRLFAGMNVGDHLLLAQPPRGGAWRRFLPAGVAERDAQARADAALERFGLADVRDRPARARPDGRQRMVEIARAVSAGPKLLLLDEPVAGMNRDEAEAVRALIRQLVAEGLSILLIEHDMTFVMNLCDHLYVLDFGVLIAEGRPDEVRTNPAVLDAYLGAAA